MFTNEELIVDDSYQRRSVWLLKDKVALIETILLKFVIPELFFWKSDVDPETGKTRTHVVDGQQRIKTIDDFIGGVFLLHEQFLLNEESKQKWGGKSFADLNEEDRKSFWTYDFNIVEIDRIATREEIVDMFKRLNLTNYNLNEQERRNSNPGLFASSAKKLSEHEFWDKNNLFNGSDIKRMKDIEFCAVLLLLYRNGITAQPNQAPINKAYEDYAENYPDVESDYKAIVDAISQIEPLINKDTVKFLKRGQLYTVFSIVFSMMEKKIKFSACNVNQFAEFVSLYGNFQNDYNIPSDAPVQEVELFELLKRYKLASSEGQNKHINRMIRYDVLSTFLFDLSSSQMMAQKKLLERLREYKEEKKKVKKN
jgi:hypothetical protein